MSCERYQEVLIEAAGEGAALPVALHEHVEVCAECCATFAAEQTLFAAIDSNLRCTAGAEVPPSFLPRVRTSLADEPTPRRALIPHWAIAAATAGVLLSLVAAQNFRQRARHSADEVAASNRTAASINTSSSSHTSLAPAPSIKSHAPGPSRTQLLAVSSRANSQEPEVLVPPGEEALLLRFCQTLRRTPDHGAALVADAHDAEPKSLAIAPLEFTELDITTLEERDDAGK
jgi:hypothetical protein